MRYMGKALRLRGWQGACKTGGKGLPIVWNYKGIKAGGLEIMFRDNVEKPGE